VVKFYVYISDDKLSMLGAQVRDGKLRRIGRKLDVNIDVLGIGASVKAGDPRPSDALRFDRLRLIERSIDVQEIGPISSGRPWIRESLRLRWGFVDSAQQAVCFTECTTSRVFVMGGSAKHLVGGMKVDQQSHHAYSILPVLISTLLEHAHTSIPFSSPPDEPIEAAGILAATIAGHAQNFEFLAKRLLSTTDRQGRQVILASPLFVAMES